MQVTISEITFEKLLNATKNIVGKNDPRDSLNHIKLIVKKDSITAFACDGYRVSKITFAAQSEDEFVVWFKPFPFKASKSGNKFVKIELFDKYVLFSVQNEIYEEQVYRMPKKDFQEQIYSSVENLISIKREQKIAVNAKILKDALNAVSSVTLDYNKTVIIRTVTDDPKVSLLAQTKDTEFDFQQIVLPLRID